MFWHFLIPYNRAGRASSPGQAGFGLVELMVSITVMIIVASIILTRHSAFNSAVLLRNQAFEIALNIREVQLSAVSASGNSGDFRSVYGLYFTSSESSIPDNGHYQVFEDSSTGPDANGFYDVGEEYSAIGTLDNRFEVREIRIGTVPKTEATVVFVRPNFDAIFFEDGTSGPVSVDKIEIDVARRGVIGSDPSVVRTIEVTSTGQISVQ
jgi:type II secretory pathway pseudopilin PulG